MTSPIRHSARTAAIAAVAIVVLLVLGSAIYWLAEGRPGSPDDFRRRVGDAGLNVAWSNAGPRGGSGVVDTACGPVDVAITEMDDRLWIRWGDRQVLVTTETINALLACNR